MEKLWKEIRSKLSFITTKNLRESILSDDIIALTSTITGRLFLWVSDEEGNIDRKESISYYENKYVGVEEPSIVLPPDTVVFSIVSEKIDITGEYREIFDYDIQIIDVYKYKGEDLTGLKYSKRLEYCKKLTDAQRNDKIKHLKRINLKKYPVNVAKNILFNLIELNDEYYGPVPHYNRVMFIRGDSVFSKDDEYFVSTNTTTTVKDNKEMMTYQD